MSVDRPLSKIDINLPRDALSAIDLRRWIVLITGMDAISSGDRERTGEDIRKKISTLLMNKIFEVYCAGSEAYEIRKAAYDYYEECRAKHTPTP